MDSEEHYPVVIQRTPVAQLNFEELQQVSANQNLIIHYTLLLRNLEVAKELLWIRLREKYGFAADVQADLDSGLIYNQQVVG